MKHKEIYKEYLEGKISLQEAWEKFKNLPKPWTTKEWKERRKEVLKESCEYCGSDNGLVIQHLPFKDKSKMVRHEVEEYFISKLDKRKLRVYAKELAAELKKKSKLAYLCPKCQRSMQLTDKWTKYRCPACKVKYDEKDIPATRAVLIVNKLEPIDGEYARETFRKKLERRKARELLWEKKDEVSHMVFEVNIDMYEDYLSMDNTKTLCKKCAYIEDKGAGLITDEQKFIKPRPVLIESQTPGAIQKNWKTPNEFPHCPAKVGDNALDEYLQRLTEGEVFSRDKYGEAKVVSAVLSESSDALVVLCNKPGLTPWTLARVYIEDKQIVHEGRGIYFFLDDAQKFFTLARGLEWEGGDTFDDYV